MTAQSANSDVSLDRKFLAKASRTGNVQNYVTLGIFLSSDQVMTMFSSATVEDCTTASVRGRYTELLATKSVSE